MNHAAHSGDALGSATSTSAHSAHGVQGGTGSHGSGRIVDGSAGSDLKKDKRPQTGGPFSSRRGGVGSSVTARVVSTAQSQGTTSHGGSNKVGPSGPRPSVKDLQ